MRDWFEQLVRFREATASAQRSGCGYRRTSAPDVVPSAPPARFRLTSQFNLPEMTGKATPERRVTRSDRD